MGGSNHAGEVCDHSNVGNDEPGPCGFSGSDLFALGSGNADGDPKDTRNGGLMQPWSDPDSGTRGSMRGKRDGSWAFQGDNDSGIGKHRGGDAESCVVM